MSGGLGVIDGWGTNHAGAIYQTTVADAGGHFQIVASASGGSSAPNYIKKVYHFLEKKNIFPSQINKETFLSLIFRKNHFNKVFLFYHKALYLWLSSNLDLHQQQILSYSL